MEMTGERRLPAPRARVWQALNDPEILRASIPGCRTLEPDGENGFKATAGVKVGPISTSFSGQVRLLDLVPPVSYRIEGSGNGGPAGVAKGGANVRLSEQNGETLLTYSVNAEVGGKLAQLGARLIDATARQMADQFFDNFAAAVAVPPDAPQSEAQPEAVRSVMGLPWVAWAAAVVFLFIAAALFG
jgi:carbon monoxide dehydrogenase subunit G